MKLLSFIPAAIIVISLSSCGYTKKFNESYFKENESVFESMRQRFRQQHAAYPFSLEIKDKSFKQIGIEITNDTMRYIYNFSIDGQPLLDSLKKYHFNVPVMMELIHDMQKTRCTWLTNLDYYENLEKRNLVFFSVRHAKLESVFRKDRYFTMAWFNFPQPFDAKGRLLDRKDRKRLRKFNGAIYNKLTDRVAYAYTRLYR